MTELTERRRRELMLGVDDPDRAYANAVVARFSGDLGEAKLLLEFAARRGHAGAQNELGNLCYEEGALRAAERWWRLAVWQRKHPGAQRCLAGLSLQRGDYTAAVNLMRESAEGGDIQAQRVLADMLVEADAVWADPVEAVAWLTIASEREPLPADAEQSLAQLTARLSPRQLARAQKTAGRLRKRIALRTRRYARLSRRRPHTGARHYVGSTGMMGSFETWTVSYEAQRFGMHDWILHVKSPSGRSKYEATGPHGLITNLYEQCISVDGFARDLCASGERALRQLGLEIQFIRQLRDAPSSAAAPSVAVVPPVPVVLIAPPQPPVHRDLRTYVDHGDLRIYRHPPAPRRAFEAVLNIGDRANGLIVGSPDGCNEADIELRADTEDGMKPVVRLHGQVGTGGRLEVTVTNVLTGEQQVIPVLRL